MRETRMKRAVAARVFNAHGWQMLTDVIRLAWPADDSRRLRMEVRRQLLLPLLPAGGPADASQPWWRAPTAAAADEEEPAAAGKEAPTTEAARVLDAALRRHCPGVALSNLRRWVLRMRAEAGRHFMAACPAHGAQQAQHRMLRAVLCDSRRLVEPTGGSLLMAHWSAALVRPANFAPARALPIFERALAACKDSQCWMVASGVLHAAAAYRMDRALDGRGAAQRAHLEAAAALLAEHKSLEPRIKAWLPQHLNDSLVHRRRDLAKRVTNQAGGLPLGTGIATRRRECQEAHCKAHKPQCRQAVARAGGSAEA
ncbi:hypothetical protein ABPG75_010215 [Micractinium tetrahymenae]